MASADESLFTCAICLDVAQDAVETSCCHQLFCELCVKGIKDCPLCRKNLVTSINHVIRRMVGTLKKPCQYCKAMFPRADMVSHVNICFMRPSYCIVDECDFNGNRESILNHLITVHSKELTNSDYKIVPKDKPSLASQSVDLIGRKINSFRRHARLGETGKYYCIGPLDTGCLCCDGSCGPTNGCNCTACFSLDLSTRKLPDGYVINKSGYPVRKGEFWQGMRRYYCGRIVMSMNRSTDGWCGYDDGDNCPDCKTIQQQVETGGCYSAIVGN